VDIAAAGSTGGWDAPAGRRRPPRRGARHRSRRAGRPGVDGPRPGRRL